VASAIPLTGEKPIRFFATKLLAGAPASGEKLPRFFATLIFSSLREPTGLAVEYLDRNTHTGGRCLIIHVDVSCRMRAVTPARLGMSVLFQSVNKRHVADWKARRVSVSGTALAAGMPAHPTRKRGNGEMGRFANLKFQTIFNSKTPNTEHQTRNPFIIPHSSFPQGVFIRPANFPATFRHKFVHALSRPQPVSAAESQGPKVSSRQRLTESAPAELQIPGVQNPPDILPLSCAPTAPTSATWYSRP